MIGFLKRYKSKCFIYSISILTFILSTNVQACCITKEQKRDLQIEITRRMEAAGNVGIFTYPYTKDCDEATLAARFEQMSKERWKVYFTNPEDYGKPGSFGKFKDDYKTPEYYKIWNSRYSYPMAFSYNLAIPEYNASIVKVPGYTFLAIEAPSSLNKNAFYDLIGQSGIGALVKLNSPDEYPTEDYFPYWKGWTYCNLFSYNWPHRSGLDASTLLNFIKSVQTSKPQGIIAVSCRAGAGRTGTFIAGYIIINEIDKQLKSGKTSRDIAINIDKIVWEISVQRPFAITHSSQYQTLYRLVDLYLRDK